MNQAPSPRRGPVVWPVVWTIAAAVAVGVAWILRTAAATTHVDSAISEGVSIDPGRCSQGACRDKAEWLTRQLGEGATAFVEPPWAVVGTAKTETLAGVCRDVLIPTACEFANEFGLQQTEVEPIGVLVFFDEREYRNAARRILGETDVSRYGFHVPHLRLILANCATGPRVLRHEAVHALIDRHRGGVPPWLDEGLAALYETPPDGAELTTLRAAFTRYESVAVADSRRGVLREHRWRETAPTLGAHRAPYGSSPPLHHGSALPRLESLASPNWTLEHHDGLSRIYLRWFCAFLREKGRLAAVWQRAQEARQTADGSTGSLLDAAALGTTAAIELHFLDWLGRQAAPLPDANSRDAHARTP